MGGEVIDIYIYRERERGRETARESERESERENRVEQSRVGSRKKDFVKDSMLKRTKNVVFIYFASLIIK